MQALQKTIETTMDEMQRTHLIPLQKDAFLCSAKCCDRHKDMEALQQCTVNCQQKVHAAHQVLYGNLEAFQERFKRCLMRCDDAAREGLPHNPSEKDIHKAQDQQVACMDACAKEYTAKVPKMQKDCQSGMKQLGT